MIISFYKKITYSFLLAVFLFSPAISFSAEPNKVECPKGDGYCLLEPIFADQVNTRVNMADYLKQIYKVFFITAGTLATLMLIVGGFQYMTSEAGGSTSKAKERMKNAVWGLLLALGSYLILYTINPALLNVNFEPKPIPGLQGPNVTTPTTPGAGSSDCANCVELKLPINGKACKALPCKVDANLNTKLLELDAKLKQAGIKWWITEAWEPTVTHKDPCHLKATCVDANFSGGTTASVTNINKFMDAATASGLRAVYEVSTQAEVDGLKRAGVKGSVIPVAHATGRHFSVYNRGGATGGW